MTNIEKIEEIAVMQRALDNAISKKHNTGPVNINSIYIALLDELGELTHELKSNWCWWKKTVNECDRTLVLGELVDVWHFVLTIKNITHESIEGFEDEDWPQGENLEDKESYVDACRNILSRDRESIVKDACMLTWSLGFTVDDIYVGYIEKNQINYERLSSGY